MFNSLIKSLGLDIPAEIIDAVGASIKFIGEMTDNDTILSIGEAIQETSETISS